MANIDDGSDDEKTVEKGIENTCQSDLSEDYFTKRGDGDSSKISILCEIIGARHLAAYDDGGTKIDTTLRPFCLVKVGERIIHKTKSEDGVNPIWTVSTRSLFLLKVTPLEIGEGSLKIILFSKQRGIIEAEKIFIGQTNLDLTSILSHCDEQRHEFDLGDEGGYEEEEGSISRGKLAIRFRIATKLDEEMVNSFQSKVKPKEPFSYLHKKNERPKIAKLLTETSKTKVVKSSFAKSMKNLFTPNIVHCEQTGTSKLRMKPYPDPDRLENTTFMTAKDIRHETMLPSKNWVKCGSGSLGKLKVEILSCHGLPNLDVGEAVGNLTDSFVSLVYEDSCAMTEVIDDELSPHWLPWTQRAFCFGMIHPASTLYLGVFDYDLGLGNYTPIGRVAVNVSNFQKDTTYNLKYNLYPSSNVTDRTAVGSIRIRIQIECFDEKAALLKALKPRPKMHVNVKRERTFKVIRYTCFGEFDNEEKFDSTVIRSYINELYEYKSNLGYIVADSIQSLVFWRGQVEIFSIRLPLHSFLFYCSATTLIERPQLIVPFFLIGIAWIMLANLTIRRQHPSPWNSCPSFWQFLNVLLTGESTKPISRIKRFQGNKAAEAYERRQRKRLEEDKKVAEKKADLQQQINTIGDDRISTEIIPGGIPLEFLNRLGRYQGYIGSICRLFRFIKTIVTWEESVVSFWITAIFLAAGIFSLLLPWCFIIKWTSRVLIYGIFGPHMKLVDLCLRYNKNHDRAINKLVEKFNVESCLARLRREEAVKLKEIKALAFGRFSTLVPSFNIARHFDRPLPESWAKIMRDSEKDNSFSISFRMNESSYIPGQQLHGVMIPVPEVSKLLLNEEDLYRKRIILTLKRLFEKTATGNNDNIEISSVMGNDDKNDMDVPSGYEIIPKEDNLCQVRLADSFTESQVSSESESSTVPKNGTCKRNIIEQSESFSTALEVEKNPSEDEEGIEIVGLGRYSSWADNEEEEEREEREPFVCHPLDPKLDDHSSNLSEIHSSSERVLIAFYRPTESRE